MARAKSSKQTKSAGAKASKGKATGKAPFKRLRAARDKAVQVLSRIAKAPGHAIFALDYGVEFALTRLKRAAVFFEQVMLKPAHGTKLYRRYRSLGDSPRLAVWVVLVTFLWILSGSFSGGGAPARNPEIQGGNRLQSVQIKQSDAELYQAIINISGVTQAEHKLTLRAQTSGTVAKILKIKGSPLKADEPFLELNNEIRRAELKRARAAYNQKRLENQAAASLAKGGYQSRVKASEVRASFASAEASLAQAQYNLDKSRFSVPFAGTLIASPLEIGDFVSVGTEVGTVIDLDPIKITGYVSEHEVKQLAGNSEIDVIVDGETHRGTVVFISPSANERTRSFEVEVRVDNPESKIRDGVPVTMRLPESERLAHFVSAGWLTLNSLGTVGVRLVDDEDTVRFMPVAIIEDTGAGVWVTGLPDAVRVITVGQELVAEGEQVIAVPDNSEA